MIIGLANQLFGLYRVAVLYRFYYRYMSYFTGQDLITAGFSGALHAGVLTAGAILNRNLFNDLTALTKEIRKINKEKKDQ